MEKCIALTSELAVIILPRLPRRDGLDRIPVLDTGRFSTHRRSATIEAGLSCPEVPALL
jgi:hypothetical protein